MRTFMHTFLQNLGIPCTLMVTTVGGCSHDGEYKKQQEQSEQEIDLLKARIQRLERQQSDLESKIGLMANRREQPERQEVSSDGLRQKKSKTPTVEKAPAAAMNGGIGLKSVELSSTLPYPMERTDLGHVNSMPGREVAADTIPIPPPISEDAHRGQGISNEPEVLVIDGSTLEMPLGADSAELYNWAHARLKEGRYAAAIDAFTRLQEQAPGHHLADNAYFWAAIAQESNGDRKQAIKQWRNLPYRYPKSAKNPDALFHIAKAFEGAGELAKAADAYTQFLKRYPKAEKRAEAGRALKELRKRM
jgi:tol-pal system protein YbgF